MKPQTPSEGTSGFSKEPQAFRRSLRLFEGASGFSKEPQAFRRNLRLVEGASGLSNEINYYTKDYRLIIHYTVEDSTIVEQSTIL